MLYLFPCFISAVCTGSRDGAVPSPQLPSFKGKKVVEFNLLQDRWNDTPPPNSASSVNILPGLKILSIPYLLCHVLLISLLDFEHAKKTPTSSCFQSQSLQLIVNIIIKFVTCVQHCSTREIRSLEQRWCVALKIPHSTFHSVSSRIRVADENLSQKWVEGWPIYISRSCSRAGNLGTYCDIHQLLYKAHTAEVSNMHTMMDCTVA